MNKQKLIDELTTEIDRLSKARDLLKGGEAANPRSMFESTLLAALEEGPLRRRELSNKLGCSMDALATVIENTRGIRTYGKGWVALVDNEKTS